MARIRTIKPDFWGSPEAGGMSRDARLLTLGLISCADDDGRFLAGHAAILGAVYPNDMDITPAKLGRWLSEVERSGMVRVYEVRGVRYGCFPSWERHQVINRRTQSKLPEPPPLASRRTHGGLTESISEDSQPTCARVREVEVEVEVDESPKSKRNVQNVVGQLADALGLEAAR